MYTSSFRFQDYDDALLLKYHHNLKKERPSRRDKIGTACILNMLRYEWKIRLDSSDQRRASDYIIIVSLKFHLIDFDSSIHKN